MPENGDKLTSLEKWAKQRKITLTGKKPEFGRVPGVIDELDEDNYLKDEALGSGSWEMVGAVYIGIRDLISFIKNRAEECMDCLLNGCKKDK